ncbi:MAG: hypothetical protein AAGH71_01310 [Planctomycetota bacterium]
MTAAPPPEAVTIVDGHVHLREAHHLPTTLNAVAAHAAHHAARLGAKEHAAAILLTEQTGEHAYDRIAAGEAELGPWELAESDGIILRLQQASSGGAILIAPGRQWACVERLEVLTLLTRASADEGLRDGMSIRDCIEAALATDALVTLPWGFGKWTGARRSLMLDLVRDCGDRIALGDSAARPMGSADRVLVAGAQAGLRVIPGTDPLPIPSHTARAGRYGYWVPGLPPDTDVRRWLAESAPTGDLDHRAVGRRDSLLVALATQVRLKLHG